MTIGELKDILNSFDDDTEVFFKPQNSSYIEDFSDNARMRKISAFWGEDFKGIVIKSDGQKGAI